MATGLTLYRAWKADGEPFELAHPLVAIRDLLRGYGYTVYDIGDYAHLTRTRPEDHTPYSQTGWPQPSPYGWGFALDIMPPTKAGVPSLAELGKQLYADRQAGVAGVGWLKYMNWEPDGDDGPCYQDRWQPTHARSDSSDRGHIHLSARTDYQKSAAAVGYDPVARARSNDMAVFTDAHAKILQNLGDYMDPRVEAEAQGLDVLRFGPQKGKPHWLVQTLKELAGRPAVVPAPVDPAAFKAALTDPEVLAALAKAINDDAAKRMEN